MQLIEAAQGHSGDGTDFDTGFGRHALRVFLRGYEAAMSARLKQGVVPYWDAPKRVPKPANKDQARKTHADKIAPEKL